MEADAIKPLKAELSKACFDFVIDVDPMIRHWPKVSRIGIGQRLSEGIFKLLESAVHFTNPVTAKETKLSTLQTMSSSCDVVLVYLRAALELRTINKERYTRLSEKAVLIGKQVGGLIKYLEKAEGKT